MTATQTMAMRSPSRPHDQRPRCPQTGPIDEVRSRQCPLLWTWVLEKMGMLEVAERLTNKNSGTQDLPRFRPPEGKPYSCLSALNYSGTKGYRGAQMQS